MVSKFILYFASFFIFILSGNCQKNDSSKTVNSVLSNHSETPELFKPICTGNNERDFALSPDGQEIFYTIINDKNEISVIFQLVKIDGKWSKPLSAPFSGKHSDLEPAFSPDGNRLYFSSNRPKNKYTTSADFDIYYVEKGSDGNWGEPINVGGPINTDKNEFFPSIANSGNIYFTAERADTKGQEDIYMAEKTDSGYADPVSLSGAINSIYYEFNAFVFPDENALIFSSSSRHDDIGNGDLYISVIDEKGEWQRAKNLGEHINSTELDYCPFVDLENGKFYFTSQKNTLKDLDTKEMDFKEYRKLLAQPGNGKGDIYSVDLKTILNY